MAVLRLFAQAREAAGTNRVEVPGDDVSAVLAEAASRFGPAFVAVLQNSKVWLNGELCDRAAPCSATDEIAVLPPVSGG
jgi:molybdopterin synthase sulfur carrier subunit